MKLIGNFRQRFASVLVSHGCGTGNNAQGTDLCEVGNKYVSHPIGEIVLLLVTRKVFQGKNDQGSALLNTHSAGCAPRGEVARCEADGDQGSSYQSGEDRDLTFV